MNEKLLEEAYRIATSDIPMSNVAAIVESYPYTMFERDEIVQEVRNLRRGDVEHTPGTQVRFTTSSGVEHIGTVVEVRFSDSTEYLAVIVAGFPHYFYIARSRCEEV